jgi:hypothetical protein
MPPTSSWAGRPAKAFPDIIAAKATGPKQHCEDIDREIAYCDAQKGRLKLRNGKSRPKSLAFVATIGRAK